MSNVLVYSPNVVGKAMAGPAIRAWEIAKSLSRDHRVVLISPNTPEIMGDGFQILSLHDPALRQIRKKADVMIAQVLTLGHVAYAKQNGIRIILDAYDPIPLEVLELFKHHPEKEKQERFQSSLSNLIFCFKMADAIICSSEKQRDLWLGLMLGLKKIDPTLYDQDNSLRKFIDAVPFGMSSQKPVKTGPGFREKYGLASSDKILLWGGGIWNWFDPLTLIKALKKASEQRSDIKLIFMGVKNPDPSVPEMAMSWKAKELAEELGMLEKTIFFNEGWIPYHERHNYLLEAHIGVSTHFEHLETRFAFRTRMLDYIWAKIPILATEGDSFGDVIKQKNLGITVPPEDIDALAEAILKMCSEPTDEYKKQLEIIQGQFQWDTVVEPIRNMINHFGAKPKKAFSYSELSIYFRFVLSVVREKGLVKCFKKAGMIISNRFRTKRESNA